MNDVVVVGLPLVAIVSGMLIRHRDLNGLQKDLKLGFDQMDSGFCRIEGRLTKTEQQVQALLFTVYKLETRMDGLEKRN